MTRGLNNSGIPLRKINNFQIAMNIESLIRENIKALHSYCSARHEFSGEAKIFLDANENAFGSPIPGNYNRYPDPMQTALKEKLSTQLSIASDQVFLGNGSDEAIDILIRIFCRPARDKVIICPPTYGIYETCAGINDIAVIKISLDGSFQPDTDNILKQSARLIFICTPNNPTGNIIDRSKIELLLKHFPGIVVIDEAYIHYSSQHSYVHELAIYPNLVVLQTLSKAWGMAGLRLGMAFASRELIAYMNKVKHPYNINTVTQQLALQALDNGESVGIWVNTTKEQRNWLHEQLTSLPFVRKVYPSETNFIFVEMANAPVVYQLLLAKGIVTRLREDHLRITVGTSVENHLLINELKNLLM
jgi:histidinol-phosphate aminotransferase